MFGDKVTGDWRKLHNEELHILYCSLNIIHVIKSQRMRWVGHVAHMGTVGKKRNMYKVMVRILQGKRLLGRTKQAQIGWDGIHWNNMAQNTDKW